MKHWTCTILGNPVAKGRPRAAVVNGRARMYTPERTASWETDAAWTMKRAWTGDPLTCGVELLVVAWFARPKRLKASALEVPHLVKPDGDNALKAAADALEKAGVLANDSQVHDARVIKRYANAGEVPRVVVALKWEADS
jgi:Holliday junction resolvase RusA-like endonuclease